MTIKITKKFSKAVDWRLHILWCLCLQQCFSKIHLERIEKSYFVAASSSITCLHMGGVLLQLTPCWITDSGKRFRSSSSISAFSRVLKHCSVALSSMSHCTWPGSVSNRPVKTLKKHLHIRFTSVNKPCRGEKAIKICILLPRRNCVCLSWQSLRRAAVMMLISCQTMGWSGKFMNLENAQMWTSNNNNYNIA